MTSVTMKTFPSMPAAVLNVMVSAAPDSEAFWDAATFIVASAPRLQENSVMGYSFLTPGIKMNGTFIGGYAGSLMMPNGSVAEIEAATTFLKDHLTTIDGYGGAPQDQIRSH